MTIPPPIPPVVMGCPTSDPSYDPSGGSNRWRAEFYRSMRRHTSGTEIVEVMLSKRRWDFAATEPIGVTTGLILPTTYLILEGAMLP